MLLGALSELDWNRTRYANHPNLLPPQRTTKADFSTATPETGTPNLDGGLRRTPAAARRNVRVSPARQSTAGRARILKGRTPVWNLRIQPFSTTCLPPHEVLLVRVEARMLLCQPQAKRRAGFAAAKFNAAVAAAVAGVRRTPAGSAFSKRSLPTPITIPRGCRIGALR